MKIGNSLSADRKKAQKFLSPVRTERVSDFYVRACHNFDTASLEVLVVFGHQFSCYMAALLYLKIKWQNNSINQALVNTKTLSWARALCNTSFNQILWYGLVVCLVFLLFGNLTWQNVRGASCMYCLQVPTSSASKLVNPKGVRTYYHIQNIVHSRMLI